MRKLDGKVALITGIGAGIGRAAARLFAESGAIVFGVDRDANTGKLFMQELHETGLQFEFFQADLTDATSIAPLVEQCWRTYGQIDVLYNNAGISIVEPFLEVTPANLERLMAVNFLATFYLCQQVIPKMLQQGDGVIINTASELSVVAQPLYTAYCASKGAVLSFTKALALEYAQTNLRINAISPGPIDTGMLQSEFAIDSHPDQARQAAIATMPIGRFGTPEEIAQVALYLASDAPRLLHGAALLVDGAKTIL